MHETLEISCELSNRGTMAATEVAQLYIRDRAGSITRPVRELKGFQRVFLEPGKSKTIHFQLMASNLSFYNQHMLRITEPGDFDIWVGGDSQAHLHVMFTLNA
jgi:beta-glucosidase